MRQGIRTEIRIVSYNIHKGFSTSNLNFILKKIKSSIKETRADVVLLQEVLGHHAVHGPKMENWPTTSQFEYLADSIWPHYAYGKNAVYTDGHHGNAILSRFPIHFSENEDISFNRLERRGLLHARVEIPDISDSLDLICLHLSLFQKDRLAQIQRLADRVKSKVPKNTPLIVGGDFNDWNQKLSPILASELNLKEAFFERTGSHARTFPSALPALKLDRLYFRGLECQSARLAHGNIWSDLSDHMPIVSDFTFDD